MISKERAQSSEDSMEETAAYSKALNGALCKYKTSLDQRSKGLIYDGARTICVAANYQFLNNFKKKLNKTTLIRYFNNGMTVPVRKGPPSKISENLLRCMSLHISMMQVYGRGEAKPRDVRGTLASAIKGTPYEGMNLNYTYEKLRIKEAEKMRASISIQVEDIRCQWTTF